MCIVQPSFFIIILDTKHKTSHLQFVLNHVGDTPSMWKKGVCVDLNSIDLFSQHMENTECQNTNISAYLYYNHPYGET